MSSKLLNPLCLIGMLLIYFADGGFAQPTILLNNLNAPGPGQGAIGDIQTVLPGSGFAAGFETGTMPYLVSSVTFEFIGTSLPAAGFGVDIYSGGPSDTFSPPPMNNWAFTPFGQLGNPAIDHQPTLWPGQTTYITFTPTTPIILAPSSFYWIGASEAADGNDDNGMLFAYSQNYDASGGVQAFLNPSAFNQWTYNQDNNGWSLGSVDGFGGLNLELAATAVPEPGTFNVSTIGLLLIISFWRTVWPDKIFCKARPLAQ